MRQTSIDAYNDIKENGLLSRTRLIVYACLFRDGPMTQSETEAALASSNSGKPKRVTSYHKRFAELERQKVIAVVGERICRITGRKVTEWDVTAALPVALPKEEPLRKQLARANKEIEMLRQEIASRAPQQLRLNTGGPLQTADNYAQRIADDFVRGGKPLKQAANGIIQEIFDAFSAQSV